MNWERTAEQRRQAHRYRQKLRQENQAGRRRQHRRSVRQQYGIPEPPVPGPPPPGQIPLVWLLAERRYLYRYGWPLPSGWNTTTRPRQPKLNADGDHRHVVAMHIAHDTLSRMDAPLDWERARISRAIALELAAVSRTDDTRRPILLRSAAWLACDGNLPNQAELIAAYTLSRYPEAQRLQWPSQQELASSRQRLAQDDELRLSEVLVEIALIADLLAEHRPDTRLRTEQISRLAQQIHNERIPDAWPKPSGSWAPPDRNAAITFLASKTRAVMLQRPDWPEAVELARVAQELLNNRLRG